MENGKLFMEGTSDDPRLNSQNFNFGQNDLENENREFKSIRSDNDEDNKSKSSEE